MTHHDLSAGSFVVVHNVPASKSRPDHPIGGLCYWQSSNAGRKVDRPGLGGSASPPSIAGRSRPQRSAEPHAGHVVD